MKTRRLLVGLAISVGLAGVWVGSVSGDGPAAPVGSRSFDAALIARGAQLSAIGNCATCHTRPGGKSFAGGLPLATPFGVIYSTNITPDVDSGIGAWTEADFLRAMHDGVDRAGRNLYPAFPFDHFTRVTDDDVSAIYAYIITRDAVPSHVPANRLMFPMNIRPLLSAWKALYFERGVYRPDPGHNAEWNRGAYLVEGLGHCGACHTPRNALGAEKSQASFAGGDVDNWHAYAINGQSSAPVPWDAEALFGYLRQGWHPDHGVARGPMAEVVSNLSEVPESDVRAIATYMAGVFGAPTAEHKRRGDEVLAQASSGPAQPANGGTTSGAQLYAAACATCHATDRAPPFGGINLALSTALTSPDARNAANIVLSGIRPTAGERSPIMPGFADSMNDGQIAAVLDYLRTRFGNAPPWTNTADIVRDIRRTQTVLLQRDKP
jgi:mono/diheme cytochrome c family protein